MSTVLAPYLLPDGFGRPALAALLQPDLAVTVFLTVGIASAMVCAIAYLFSEFALRPISARALTGRERLDAPSGVGRRMVLFWSLGSGVPVMSCQSRDATLAPR